MEGGSDMANSEAVVRPLSASLHVADHCKNSTSVTIFYGTVAKMHQFS